MYGFPWSYKNRQGKIHGQCKVRAAQGLDRAIRKCCRKNSEIFGLPRRKYFKISHLHPVNLGCISWNVSFTYLSPLVDQRYTAFIPVRWIFKSIKSKNKDYFSLPPKFVPLVPVFLVQVSKTWRIHGSLSRFRRKFSAQLLASNPLQMVLRRHLKRTKKIASLRYVKKLEMWESSFMRPLIFLRFTNGQATDDDLINFLDTSIIRS